MLTLISAKLDWNWEIPINDIIVPQYLGTDMEVPPRDSLINDDIYNKEKRVLIIYYPKYKTVRVYPKMNIYTFLCVIFS